MLGIIAPTGAIVEGYSRLGRSWQPILVPAAGITAPVAMRTASRKRVHGMRCRRQRPRLRWDLGSHVGLSFEEACGLLFDHLPLCRKSD